MVQYTTNIAPERYQDQSKACGAAGLRGHRKGMMAVEVAAHWLKYLTSVRRFAQRRASWVFSGAITPVSRTRTSGCTGAEESKAVVDLHTAYGMTRLISEASSHRRTTMATRSATITVDANLATAYNAAPKI